MSEMSDSLLSASDKPRQEQRRALIENPSKPHLCDTYATANNENRKLIKLMAELSISKAEGIPTRRYSP